MAATRKPTPEQQERTRAAIKTTQLVKRLQCFALGSNDDQGKPVELDAPKLKAIEVLLRKTLPDLQAITLAGDPDNPLVHQIERKIVRPSD